jgi:hypothetical protein
MKELMSNPDVINYYNAPSDLSKKMWLSLPERKRMGQGKRAEALAAVVRKLLDVTTSDNETKDEFISRVRSILSEDPDSIFNKPNAIRCFICSEGHIWSINNRGECNYPSDVEVVDGIVRILGRYDDGCSGGRLIEEEYSLWPSLTSLALHLGA